jgi:hypothetical protein
VRWGAPLPSAGIPTENRMKSYIITALFLFATWAGQAQTNQPVSNRPLPDFGSLKPVALSDSDVGLAPSAPASGRLPAQNQPSASSTPNAVAAVDFTKINLPDPLITISGNSYSGAKIGSVSPADIGITYFDSEGVWRSKLVKITDLPEDLQKQFNYNTNAAAKYEAAQAKEDAKFVPRSGMSPSELRMYYYDNTIDRRIDEINEEIAEEKAAEKAREEELQERSVEAQEEAARAATIQALNPPVQQTTVIVNP